MVAETVDARHLQQANALLSLSTNSSFVVGPAVAGILVAVWNPGWAYAIDALSFLLSAVAWARLPARTRERQENTPFRRQLADGWREVIGRPWLWRNLITHGLWNLGFSMVFVLGPVFAVRRLGGSAAWGAFWTGIAVGSVIGSALALRVRTPHPLVTGNLALVLGAAPFLAMAAGLPAWAVVGGAIVATAGLGVLSALWNATVQQIVPREIVSRVTANDWLVSLSITPLGYLVAGLLSTRVPLSVALLVPAALIAVPSLLINLSPVIRAVRREPDGTIAYLTRVPEPPASAAAV
jgi:hypothetical protein